MSTRLRILHVIHSDDFAGVEQFVRRLACAQAADHDVRVVGGNPAMMAPALEAAGARFRPSGSLARLVSTVGAVASRVDVINTHMTAADLATVVAVGWRPERPALIATRHFSQRRGSTGPDAIYRLIERRLDAEIAVSRAVATSIQVSSTVVYPGVPVVAPSPGGSRRPIVLIAQRLQPEKATALGVHAFAASGLAAEGWKLEIAGAGEDEGELRRLIEELGLDGAVRMLGFRSDVATLMTTAGMLLATSPFEHFGLTVLEAMATGLPVVASAAGGHLELMEGVDPRALYPAGDVDAAAQALRALAHDESGRASLGAAEQKRQASVFTLDAQSAATESVYHRALAERWALR